LEKLGVVLGDRRKMLRAISNLEAAEKSAPAIAAAATASAVPVGLHDTAERRQVTVMFSDLVGSTALSARMDPEDLREVILAYQKSVAETVQRFGGFLAKYMGDGVLIYFGYPQAHEDDADRAVRSGLELIAAVTALKSPVPLQTRVGIATGLVVVGDLIGSGEAQERGIVGETPNLAARLQSIAEPNMVVLAEDTRRLLGNLFELEDLGAKDLKGISGPVRACAARRASSAEGRFEAMHATALTALVGREEETELLLRRWSKAKTGEGQVVLLSGEAGIGKSRLTAALLERLASEPHTRLRYFCSPQHTDSALYPIISQMQRAAGFAHDDNAQAKYEKLDALLVQSPTPRQDAALLAEMLSLPNDGRYPTLQLAPQQRRQKTLEALTAQMETLSRSKPVLMIFEDVHWIDPTSLEALGRAVDRITALSVLLIVTYRPEFEPPWIGRPHVTAITVNRLGQREIAAMIARVTGNKSLPANIQRDIIERTDGIPLFVEEMTKAVLETESEESAERTVAAVPSRALAVPATLHASLMARLDRLGPAKEVAQIGAAIGREFSHELIAAVVRRPEVELTRALDRLIEAGLLFRQGMAPHGTYLFKHALVRDAAYSTLLRGRRQELHNQIVSALQQNFPELVVIQPEVLAHHSAEAGAPAEAIEYYLLAAKRATAAMNNKEAKAHLKRGITLAEQLPASDPRRPKLVSRLGVAGWWH
jgi:class 3 adenylate cyclase